MDYIMMKDGRNIPYIYDLCYDGIIATAEIPAEGLSKEEKEYFESKLKSERDLVKLYWSERI